MEVSALKYAPASMRWRSPVARRQSDERLVASVRRGNHGAFTVLVKRYESRLLAFCRQMLRSREDAEDVLQEVFVAAFNAMIADDRPINVQPWLYRIARNRSLNHLRRIKAISVDPMEMPEAEIGTSTADTVHRREELQLLVDDIQQLPETQRSALVLREMEALSYDQIAEVMDKSVPSVKSLLVRARVSLAATREERASGKGLAALLPLGPLTVLRRCFLSHLGHSTGAGATAAGAGGAAIASSPTGGMVVAGIGAMATKTAAGLAAAALVTAGAVAIEDGSGHPRHHRAATAGAPPVEALTPQEASSAPARAAAVAVPAHVPVPASRGPVVAPSSLGNRRKLTATLAAAATPAKQQPAKAVADHRTKAGTVSSAHGAPAAVTTDASHAKKTRVSATSDTATKTPATTTLTTTESATSETTAATSTTDTVTTATGTTTATTTMATTTTATTTTATATTTTATGASTPEQ